MDAELLAKARRDSLLAQAKNESWPSSDTLIREWAEADPQAATSRLEMMRAEGQLLGVWVAAEGTYFYPTFQFLAGWRVHPEMRALLNTLAQMPSYSPTGDRSGWGRLDWLYTPRRSLSERSIAEERAPGGVADHEECLSNEGRIPAQVFQFDPAAVIRTAREEADAVRNGY